MSWEGFKKAINRAGHSVIIKNVDKTIDKEYDMEDVVIKFFKEQVRHYKRKPKVSWTH